jgi:uncharacterized repeat protein (TIGR01451 family)
VSTNCTIAPADLDVSQIADVEPVTGGQNVTYTVTLTNNGPSTAYNLVLTDNVPTDLTFVSVTPPGGWSCDPPSGGQYSCTASSLASSASAIFSIVYRANYCTGSVATTHTVSVSNDAPDPTPGNDTSDLVTNITDPGVCSDFDLCTTGDTCSGSVCVGTPVTCDDSDACTTDTCDPSDGLCDFVGITCDDGNSCTDDTCDTVTGCVFTNNDANSCDDGDPCTEGDACSAGSCIGPPKDCSDGNVCTDDSCEAGTGNCLHANNTDFCDDGSACTSGDQCGPVFSENFDGVTPPALPAGWSTTLVTGVGGDIAFETTSSFSDTLPNAAWTDSPDHVTDKVLDSPSIAIATATAELTFRHRYDFEQYFDGAVLEISIGGGAFADILAAGGAFAAGDYDGTISTGDGSPIAGRSAWTGASTGFEAVTVNLPASAAGQSIVMRWRVASDILVDGPGYWVDSIEFTEPGSIYTCSGTAITCDDANVCTVDSCDPGSGCIFPPGNPGTECRASAAACDPAEVCDGVSDVCPPDSTGQSTALGETVQMSYESVTDTVTIGWSGEVEAGPFNLYRGDNSVGVPWSYDHTCLESGISGTSTTDATAVADDLFYYLVSRVTTPCAESSLGLNSDPAERPNTSSCP